MNRWLQTYLGIWISLILALGLTVIALPQTLQYYRPDWVALASIYWSLALPRRFGPGSAWISGLLMDALTGTLLGQHALALAVLSYLGIRFHQQIRLQPLWQQTLSIGILLAIYRLLVLWIYGVAEQPPATVAYWYPLMSDLLFWPIIYLLLRGLRRGLKMAQ